MCLMMVGIVERRTFAVIWFLGFCCLTRSAMNERMGIRERVKSSHELQLK